MVQNDFPNQNNNLKKDVVVIKYPDGNIIYVELLQFKQIMYSRKLTGCKYDRIFGL